MFTMEGKQYYYISFSVTHRFTELYVDEQENEGDLRILVADYLKCLNPHRNVINGIIRLAFTVMIQQVKSSYHCCTQC